MYFTYLNVYKKLWGVKNFPCFFHVGFEWSLGFIILNLILVQFVSGIYLSFFYNMGLEVCLYSKFFILKEVYLGWAISYFHMVGPSFIFLFVYLHLFKSLFYSVYMYNLVWSTGFFLLFCLVVVCFTGYSIVCGSLGFWAIVVVSNIFEFLFGMSVSFLIFTDFGSVSDFILFKFFMYHFIFSLLFVLLSLFHIYSLHMSGSSNGIYSSFVNLFSFLSNLFLEELLGFLLVSLVVCFVYFFYPEFVESVDNFLELDLFKVPEEMNSEWYLSLIFILIKVVSSKSLGVFLMGYVFFVMYFKMFFSSVMGEFFGQGFMLYSMMFFIFFLLSFTPGKWGGGSIFTVWSSLFYLNVFVDYFMVDLFFLFFYFLNDFFFFNK